MHQRTVFFFNSIEDNLSYILYSLHIYKDISSLLQSHRFNVFFMFRAIDEIMLKIIKSFKHFSPCEHIPE